MAENDDDVVEAVVAPEALGAAGEGQLDGFVVVRAGRVVAPAVVGSYGAGRMLKWRHGQPVGSKQHPADRPSAGRRRAVALQLSNLNAGPAQRAREPRGSTLDHASRRSRAERPDDRDPWACIPCYHNPGLPLPNGVFHAESNRLARCTLCGRLVFARVGATARINIASAGKGTAGIDAQACRPAIMVNGPGPSRARSTRLPRARITIACRQRKSTT